MEVFVTVISVAVTGVLAGMKALWGMIKQLQKDLDKAHSDHSDCREEVAGLKEQNKFQAMQIESIKNTATIAKERADIAERSADIASLKAHQIEQKVATLEDTVTKNGNGGSKH